MVTNEALIKRLREAQARSSSGALEQLLEQEINISKGIRETASTSQNHLRGFLASEHDRDPSFPRVLSTNDNDFLGGSFARHVKNWPLDDIDVYLPLDGYNLTYNSSGLRLPYTVISDDILSSNPLLTNRWTIGQTISSAKLVNEFAVVLRRHYPEKTEVQANGEAVTIRMKQGETESGEGLGYDVVPCFSLKPDNPLELPFYLISDGIGGWKRTNPRRDLEISEQLQKNNDKTFRKAVKLVKFWNTDQLGGVMSSYYIELAIARAFMKENEQGEYMRSVSLATALAFWAVNQAVTQGDQTSWIANTPLVKPGDLSVMHKVTLGMANTNALEAWNKEKAGEHPAALRAWQNVFGAKLPQPV